ncbi:protein hunchback-like [Octopus sinensis]|uniref:Protein hunchback-like n=1 Tax=Octopus sinensis TaxID=2607531 RepID=A0A6P7TVQ8_9MOLL|nr:protein hunchback-like [Octopus sinensis]
MEQIEEKGSPPKNACHPDLPSQHNSSDENSPTDKCPSYEDGKRKRKRKLFKCRHCDYSTAKEVSDSIYFQEDFYRHKEDKHLDGGAAYRCELCSFVTRMKHHLDYHNLSRHNSGEKPFSCDKCEYKCINRSMLNSHMRSHLPPCSRCGVTKLLFLSIG